MAYGFCPKHKCDLTGIGSLSFCPRCEEEGTTVENQDLLNQDLFFLIRRDPPGPKGEICTALNEPVFSTIEKAREVAKTFGFKAILTASRKHFTRHPQDLDKHNPWQCNEQWIGLPVQVAETL